MEGVGGYQVSSKCYSSIHALLMEQTDTRDALSSVAPTHPRANDNPCSEYADLFVWW